MASPDFGAAVAHVSTGWNASGARLEHPAFASVREQIAALRVATRDDAAMPGLAALNALAGTTTNCAGKPIRFVAPCAVASGTAHYELRVARAGEVATRDNWHDLFNALVWVAFPRTKAAISEMHARIIEERGAVDFANRPVARDFLTLFDESGAVVVCEDASLIDSIRAFRWKEVFWTARERFGTAAEVYVFGHSILEKMLAPFIGITAKAICVPVPRAWFAQGRAERQAWIDAHIAEFLSDARNLASTQTLAPFPLLGISGWHHKAADPRFYDDVSYFRRGFMRAKGTIASEAGQTVAVRSRIEEGPDSTGQGSG